MMSTEPYRRKLSYMWWRLDERRLRRARGAAREDLGVIRRSLEANRGGRVAEAALAALARRVELFGFHVAKLDVRLHASEVRSPTERTRGVFDAVAAARAPPRRRARSTR